MTNFNVSKVFTLNNISEKIVDQTTTTKEPIKTTKKNRDGIKKNKDRGCKSKDIIINYLEKEEIND